MNVIFGVLVALAGLVLIGTGGSSVRRPRNFRIPIGIALIVVGALFAAFAGNIQMIMGWAHP
jgi:drug/metabolite transporter (DMT)-like permease